MCNNVIKEAQDYEEKTMDNNMFYICFVWCGLNDRTHTGKGKKESGRCEKLKKDNSISV